MITPRVKFEKQFGDGVDPWYAKAERWANKQKFPISFLALGLIEYLKKVWINVKVENTMRSVDADIEKIHELWDEEETTHRMNVIAFTNSVLTLPRNNLFLNLVMGHHSQEYLRMTN